MLYGKKLSYEAMLCSQSTIRAITCSNTVNSMSVSLLLTHSAHYGNVLLLTLKMMEKDYVHKSKYVFI